MQVNFHTHTIYSDGEQTPEALAASLAGAGVRYAALTDHDTVEGFARFGAALDKHGIPSVSGLELTTQFEGREVHLVAYGFDPDHPEVLATLVSLRQARSLDVHSIAESLRKAGTRRQTEGDSEASASAAPNGRLEVGAAIDVLHRAGGRAFLAHPLVYEPDPERLEGFVVRLKALGLDGIEAVYAQFSAADQAVLRNLARKHDLLVCAGTDFHGPGGLGNQPAVIDMPRDEWLRFRAALFAGPAFSHEAQATGAGGARAGGQTRRGGSETRPLRFRRRSFILRIGLPTAVAMVLFVTAFWGFILPSFEQTLLENKRETIRELTNSAWSILATYERHEQDGRLTREQAQSAAAGLVRDLRYGPQNKDYFWIQDTTPRMIMHPYRLDLNGRVLGNITDPRGAAIFVEFAALVKRDGQGYVDYVWQWQDDPERLEPKESYVKGFTPWDWIIGTGLYTDDVRREILRLEQNLIGAAVAISAAISVLLLIVLQQSLRIERRRQEVVEGLRDSTLRYHSLVEATTEGTLLVLDGRCRYANPTFLELLGYTVRQLEFLELADLLPREAVNDALWSAVDAGAADSPALGEAREGCLTRKDGSILECILTLNPVVSGGESGYILLARDVVTVPDAAPELGPGLAVPVGIFRAVAARRGVFLQLNAAARDLVAALPRAAGAQPGLADCFTDPAEFEAILDRLTSRGEVTDHVVGIEGPGGAMRFLSLSATLVRDEENRPAHIDGLLADVTAARNQAAARDALVEKLQASLLFLHEPIAHLGRDAVVVDLETSIGQAARWMTERQATAALVTSESGAVIGIVTDHDVRARAVAERRSPDDPVRTVMSAPLIRIPESARVYEALMRMEEHGVRHLAVDDADGTTVSVIDNRALIQFPQYGPLVLVREIARAGTPGEVATSRARVTALAGSLLDSSARPRHVTSMLTSICDAATERLIALFIDEFGPPPAPFAFLGLGSQGRQEQTLLTDQDNGIVYAAARDGAAAGAGADPQRAEGYFRAMGARVCDGLRQAGYPFCRGNVMANDPRWCRSLPDWLSGIDTWVRRAEPQDIADLSVFLDFRVVHGDAELGAAMRRQVFEILPGEPAVLYHFARNALTFKPPIRLPGNIYLGGAAEHAGEIELKDAVMPIVTFARVYAVRHGITETHTLDRIDALAARDLITNSTRDEVTAVYDFLTELRLRSQLGSIRAGEAPAGRVHPSRLGHTQRELLKQAFVQIAAIQKRIGYDFPEGG